MKKIILLAIIAGMISCCIKSGKTQNISREKIEDNQELIEIFNSDQADRRNPNITSQTINHNDSLREARVYEIIRFK